jgi:hypothetical protein
LIGAAVIAAALLAGCAVVPVDGAYYSSPPAGIGYYSAPPVSHVWIGGFWSGHRHHHGAPRWAPGHHHQWQGASPKRHWGGGKGKRGGHWRRGGHR